MKHKRGKFIVIEGIDGTGKAFQTDLLVQQMDNLRMPLVSRSFPRYDTATGKAIRAYLDGVLGPADAVPPKHASLLYAANRLEALQDGTFDGLGEGTHFIADRYVTSNMGHQGSKIADPSERTAFFLWNDELEHGRFGLPRPDLTIILHVAPEIALRNIDTRGSGNDGHENLEHLRRAEAAYLEIARSFPNCVLVECENDDGDDMLPPKMIHDSIWTEVHKILWPASSP